MYLFRKRIKLIATINYPEVAYAPKDILFTSNHKLVLYYNHLSKVYIYNTDNGQLEKNIFLPETDFPEEHSAATWYYQISENYLCEPVQHYGFYLTPLQNFEKEKLFSTHMVTATTFSTQPTRMNL